MTSNDTKPLTEAEIQEWELRFRKHTDPLDGDTADDIVEPGRQHALVLDDALGMMRRALVEIAELRERAEKAEHSARQFCGAHVGLSFTHCPACEAETQTARAELPATPSEPMTPVADHTAALGGLANENEKMRERAEEAEKERDFLVSEYERAVKCPHLWSNTIRPGDSPRPARLGRALLRRALDHYKREAKAADERSARAVAELTKVLKTATEQRSGSSASRSQDFNEGFHAATDCLIGDLKRAIAEAEKPADPPKEREGEKPAEPERYSLADATVSRVSGCILRFEQSYRQQRPKLAIECCELDWVGDTVTVRPKLREVKAEGTAEVVAEIGSIAEKPAEPPKEREGDDVLRRWMHDHDRSMVGMFEALDELCHRALGER